LLEVIMLPKGISNCNCITDNVLIENGIFFKGEKRKRLRMLLNECVLRRHYALWLDTPPALIVQVAVATSKRATTYAFITH